jgi:hypothetical protein
MDADYGRNRDRDGAPTKAFEPRCALGAFFAALAATEQSPARKVKASSRVGHRPMNTVLACRYTALPTTTVELLPVGHMGIK